METGKEQMRFEDLNLHDVGTKIQMAAVVYHDGEGKPILIPLPGESESIREDFRSDKIDILEMSSEQWEAFVQQTDRIEVMALVKDEHGQLGKALVRKTTRQISQAVSWNCYKRDRYRCRYCGTDSVPLTVDHLVLWEEGGPSTEGNLLTSCKKCNQIRGNMSYSDWLRSPHYRKVSRNLPPAIQEGNENLVSTLSAIPRHPLGSKRSR